MMRTTLFIIYLILASLISVHAIPAKVSDANIGGHVIDDENGEHIPGCLIRILGTDIAVMTDASGHYIIRDLEPGDYVLEASMVGYVTQKERKRKNARASK